MFQYYHLQYLQIGQIHDTFNVYQWAIKDSLACDNPQEILSYLVYVYGYYPPGSKYIPSSSSLNTVIEQGREQTISLIVIVLQNKTHVSFGNDLDQWISTFGDEKTKYSYNSNKNFRKEQHLPEIRVLVQE
jgi:hypothetical protein